MSDQPRPTFHVAVVGSLPASDSKSEETRAADRLIAWLDKATARYRESHQLCLVTLTHGIGAPWARARGYSIILIPRFDGHAIADRELIEFADAVVVVGSRAQWSRLVRLANEAGKPVRYYTG